MDHGLGKSFMQWPAGKDFDLIRMIEQKLGKTARIKYQPLHPADAMANQADVTKAGRLLGWEPHIDLDTGVQRLVDWYLQQRNWASQIITH